MFSTLLLSAAVAVAEPIPEPCDCERPGILLRLRARFAAYGQPSCAPCERNVFTGFTTACTQPVDPCGRLGLLDRLKARFQRVEVCANVGECCLPVAAGPLVRNSRSSQVSIACNLPFVTLGEPPLAQVPQVMAPNLK
jgi:hypothetical protein